VQDKVEILVTLKSRQVNEYGEVRSSGEGEQGRILALHFRWVEDTHSKNIAKNATQVSTVAQGPPLSLITA